ncbi:MAG TPA: amino acid adenylation domain-containing protein, partial [Vicinamibacteria bacterium]
TRSELGLTLHHIVSDGWSVGVVLSELLRAYEAFAKGQEPELPLLPFQYGDYAEWEERWLEGEAAKQQLEYWSQRLAGPLPVVDLPADRERPKVQTFRGGKHGSRLSADLSLRIAELSRKHAATPFMTILAAFALVMNRQTGLDDLPIGVPFAGRNREGTDRLVGVFINTVVVRFDFQGDPTFEEHLLRTRSLALEAYRNADVPFDRVVDVLRPRRDPGRTPLFQVLVNSVSFGKRSRFELPGLAVELRGDAMATSKFDLTLYLGTDESGTGVTLSYNADLFHSARMGELLSQVEQVLELVTTRPDQRLSEISLLTPGAQALLPAPREPLGRTSEPPVLHGLAAPGERASRPAVTDPHTALDHGDLDRRSRGLARRLRAAGISHGDVVALRASRSADLVWGLCGVLRAGAGFVILDAAYPSARLVASLEAAAPRAWLESPGLPEVAAPVRAALDRPGWLLKAVLEPTWAEGAPGSDEEVKNPDPDDLAYIAFTSGTTGGLKGIVGGHGPLAHFLNWHIETFGLTADDRFSMISGLSHDPLLRDVFTPIRLGASIHIPDSDDLLAPERLREWMAREGITIAHLTPAMARVLAEGSTGSELESLRYAFLGGDVLTRDEERGLRRVAPSAQIVNFYGATETPQAMGFHVVPLETDAAPLPPRMPLGKGIDEVQLLVLGKDGRLAGVGELGEIGVRTPHLATGYLGDDALTRDRFVQNPFSGRSGDRLYRTGDLGRYGPDGSVQFAGRADTQVKVRGFRVELGEVEAALRDHPQVADAAAGLVESAPGDQRLVGYVVAAARLEAGSDTKLRELLRTHLKAALPAHMIPSSFVFLEALPLTRNGKVDRKALARLEAGAAGVPAGERKPPRTATEEILAGIWSEVLRVERVGVEDDFFEIGGHSLLATQVSSRVRKALGVELT